MKPEYVVLAYNGYRTRKDEERELLRHQIYWNALPNMKKGFKMSAIKLPGDKQKPIDATKLVKTRRLDG